MHNDDLKMYMDVIENNVNVSKTSDLKEFFILVAGLIFVVFLLILICDFFSNIFISNMSDKTQIKIERILSSSKKDEVLDNRYTPVLKNLKHIRRNIIYFDKDLQNKSKFPIIVTKNEMINAWIKPDGSIYFTTALLDEKFSEQELAFVLAHEIGHYKHRDHLRAISRQLSIAFISSLIFGQESEMVRKTVEKITNLEALSHSRKQEQNADKYASDMLIKIYGNNNGGIKFLKYLSKKDNMPEFFMYFSTHPSTSKRIKLLKN